MNLGKSIESRIRYYKKGLDKLQQNSLSSYQKRTNKIKTLEETLDLFKGINNNLSLEETYKTLLQIIQEQENQKQEEIGTRRRIQR